MRIIVAGSRTTTAKEVREALERCDWIGFASAVVSGTARGADASGEAWARDLGLEVLTFPADWKNFGRRAGPVRNAQMAANAEGLVAIWDGESRGTKSMIDLAKKRGLRIAVYRPASMEFEEFPPRGELQEVWEHVEERAAIMEYAGGLTRAQAERAAGAAAVTSRSVEEQDGDLQ